MQRRSSLLIGGAVLVCACRLAPAESTCVDYTGLGTYEAAEVTIEGVRAYGPSWGDVHVEEPGGLGIVGGASDAMIEGFEWLEVVFPEFAAPHVWLTITHATDADGDGQAGEILLYTSPSGTQPIRLHGTGTFYLVNPGGGPIRSFRISPQDGDGVQVGGLCFAGRTLPYHAVFSGLGSFQAEEIQVADVRVTGSGAIEVVSGMGLGVVGGASDSMVDAGEALRFDFDGLAPHVLLFVSSQVGDGAVLVTAFAPNGTPVGTATFPGNSDPAAVTVANVSSLFDGPISGFAIEPEEGNAVAISAVSYAGSDFDCAGDLDGDGATTVFDFALFAEDFSCQPGPTVPWLLVRP